MAKRSKQIVWIPSYSWDYEGGDWVGVYSTEARAFAALVEHCGDDCSHDEHWMTAIEINGEGVKDLCHEVYREQIRDAARAQHKEG